MNKVRFHLSEVPRIDKTRDRKNGRCKGLRSWEIRELLFNGYRVSVLQDVKLWR